MIDYYITPEEYEIAEQNGIHINTLNRGVRDLLWDKQRAITEKPANLSKGLSEYKKKAKNNGIEAHLFYTRVTRGWAPEEASSIPKIDNHDKARLKEMTNKSLSKTKKYPEWVYESMKENNIKQTTFANRLRRGWTLKKACTTSVQEKGKYDRSDHYWKKLSISR